MDDIKYFDNIRVIKFHQNINFINVFFIFYLVIFFQLYVFNCHHSISNQWFSFIYWSITSLLFIYILYFTLKKKKKYYFYLNTLSYTFNQAVLRIEINIFLETGEILWKKLNSIVIMWARGSDGCWERLFEWVCHWWTYWLSGAFVNIAYEFWHYNLKVVNFLMNVWYIFLI